MRDFRRDNQRDNRGNRGRSFGNDRYGSDRDRPQMYSATCANCGNQCEVPFKPTGSKPVLCRDCFRNNNAGSDNRNFERRDNDRPRFENRNQSQPQQAQPNYQKQLDELNAKVDKILEILMSAVEEAEEMEEEAIVEEPVKEVKVAEAEEEAPKEKKATKKKTKASK